MIDLPTWTWTVSASDVFVSELHERLRNEAIPFFQRFENRDQILSEFRTATDNTEFMAVPRIMCALILLTRGEREEARRLLATQAVDHTRSPGHPAYVVALAKRLGVEISS